MIKIPLCILILIGYLGDVLRLMRLKTNLCFSNMYTLYIKTNYSNVKSKSEPEVLFHSGEQVPNDAIAYFKTCER